MAEEEDEGGVVEAVEQEEGEIKTAVGGNPVSPKLCIWQFGKGESSNF